MVYITKRSYGLFTPEYPVQEKYQAAYHKNRGCKQLLKDYREYELPPELIDRRGEFNKWYSFLEGRLVKFSPSRFIAEVNRRFEVSIDFLPMIEHKNTGVEEITEEYAEACKFDPCNACYNRVEVADLF